MTVLVKITLTRDGEPLGEKTFEANFATVEPPLRFQNAIMWMCAITHPIADEMQVEAMQQIVDNRRKAIADAKEAALNPPPEDPVEGSTVVVES